MCYPGFTVHCGREGRNKKGKPQSKERIVKNANNIVGSIALPMLLALHLELATDISWSGIGSCASWELSPWLDHTIVQSDCLAETTHCIITFTLWPVAGQCSPSQPSIPPPRLHSSCSAGRHVDSPDRRIWHLYSPRSPAIINRIMSRSTVRYLILSNGQKSPPTYANAVFAAPVGRDTADVPRSSELEKSEWARQVLDVFPVKYLNLKCVQMTYLNVSVMLYFGILLYNHPKGNVHWPWGQDSKFTLKPK